MTQTSPADDSITGIEPVDRLIRVAVRLDARGDAPAADRAFKAARRVWDEQPSTRRASAADLDGIRRGLFVLRDEGDTSTT